MIKHKAEVKIAKHKDIKEYLLTSSVQSSGAISYDDENRVINTQSDNKYAIFKVEFINPNGIDTETDYENVNGVNELVKALSFPFKVVDMNVVKNSLTGNIKELEKVLNDESITDSRKVKIQDRLDVMNHYNDEKYVTTYMYIAIEDIDIFSKLATTVFNVERLNADSVVDTLCSLNNDME